jgi:hypothetical protein
VFEATGDCVKVSLYEYKELGENRAELENCFVLSPETLAEDEIDDDPEFESLGLLENEVELDGVLYSVVDVEPVALIVNHDAVWLIELVDVIVSVRLCVLVLTSVDVDVLDAKLEELLVTTILFELIDDIDWDNDSLLVFVTIDDAEIVGVILSLLELSVVLLSLLETVDVLDRDEDPVNLGELLDVFEGNGVNEFVEDIVDDIVCVRFGVIVFSIVIVLALVGVTITV